MTSAEFLVQYPEFGSQNTDPARVQAALDRAAVQIGAEVFGDRYDLAHGLLAAHLLAIAPMGESTRLVKDDRDTMYFREFRRVRRACVLTAFVP